MHLRTNKNITLASIAMLMLSISISSVVCAAESSYSIEKEVKLPGGTKWDYVTYDAIEHRLFLAHDNQVDVIDAGKLTLIASIPGSLGIHGVALAQDPR